MTTATEPSPRHRDQRTVLVVCTGNICRSPAAAALLERSLGADGSVRVTSAGTHAVVGSPVAAPMQDLLSSMVVPTAEHRGTQITARMIRDSSLVVVMTREQRSAVVSMEPSAVRRTFTLRELARLSDGLELPRSTEASMSERVVELVARAGASRRPPEQPSDDEIDDPWGGKQSAYERSLAEIHEAVRTLSYVLHGVPARQ